MTDQVSRLMNSSTLVSLCSGFVLVFYASSLLLNEWKVGTAMHEGEIRVIHVGLHNVQLLPTNPSEYAETANLRELCEMGDPDEDDDEEWRRRSRRAREVHFPMYETPRRVWCALADQGASTNRFMLAAWVPALMVSAWSTTRTLLPLLPQVAPLFDKAEAMGLTLGTVDIAITVLWSLYWLLVLVAVTMYASNTPDTFGVGEAQFGQSFELIRCCVLLSTLLAVALLARALKLWSSETVKDMVAEVWESRTLKLLLYLLLLAQVFLYLIVSLADVQFSAVICFLGLHYLATKSISMLWGYVLFTLVSLPMDLFSLVAVHWHNLNPVWFLAYTSLAIVFLLKGISLAGMLALHLKFNFRLNFRSDQPQRLYDDELDA